MTNKESRQRPQHGKCIFSNADISMIRKQTVGFSQALLFKAE
jgi:hypothetical protein